MGTDRASTTPCEDSGDLGEAQRPCPGLWEETKEQVIEAAIEPPVEIIEEPEPPRTPTTPWVFDVVATLVSRAALIPLRLQDGHWWRCLGGGPKGRRGKGAIPVAAGLRWLADHQDADGKWDCDEFFKHDPSNDQTEGPGYANHDVGVTALALLAFLGDGHTTTKGLHRATVAAGVQWLIKQQDKETGLIGEPLGKAYVYDHAIATIVLCEATTLDKATLLKRKARKAVQFISRARSPYTGWRYDVPGTGDADTSVTGWMIFAMRAAEDAGITIDEEAYKDSLEWFDNMTDPGTGRVGYIREGFICRPR